MFPWSHAWNVCIDFIRNLLKSREKYWLVNSDIALPIIGFRMDFVVENFMKTKSVTKIEKSKKS